MPPSFADRSDGVPSDGDDTYNDDSWSPLNDIVKRKTFELGLRANYTDWAPHEAFRELVQNWRDAIIQSQDISPADFCIHHEETSVDRDTEIVFKAFNRGADCTDVDECLGFIRFRGRDGAGTVEITNRGASLEPWHLQIGGTSKQGNEDQAGAHGEGLKLAALVFLRRALNNHLRCQSTGFNWHFNFKNECLVVVVHRIDMAREEARPPRKIAYKIATPEVVADRDVQFVIGESRSGRDENGFQVKRGPVQQTAFESWTKAALFLAQSINEDTGIIRTHHGELLTMNNLRGNIYLKGLLLSDGSQSHPASITGRPLWFGYNFASGNTDRDRQSVATAYEESMAMCQILSDAMKEKPEMIGSLVDILNDAETEYADVLCAEKHWPREVGLLIRGYLLRGEFADRWFYCGDDLNKNVSLPQTIEGIGRKPFEVSKKCWNILEKKKLVRTAEQEALWRFKHSEEVPLSDPSFGKSVSRLLQACIRACPQANDMEIKFMKAGQLHLNVAISEDKRVLLIHERWLTRESAIAELGLGGKMKEAKVVTFIVKNLFAEVLKQLPLESFHQEGIAKPSEWHMKREINRAEDRLVNNQEMKVRVIDKWVNGRPGLCVEWVVDGRPQDDHPGDIIKIQCHRVPHCCHLRDSLLIASDDDGQKTNCLYQEGELQLPTCRFSQVPFHQGTHYVPDLEEGEEYFFVLLTPTDRNSFVSMSENKRVVANPSASTPEQPAYHNGAFQPAAQGNDIDGESVIVVHSESPEPANGNSPSVRSHGAPQGSRAASGLPIRPMARGTPRSFSLGPALDTLDWFALDNSRGRVYKADNPENLEAFIVFKKGELRLPEETRKRRRVD